MDLEDASSHLLVSDAMKGEPPRVPSLTGECLSDTIRVDNQDHLIVVTRDRIRTKPLTPRK